MDIPDKNNENPLSEAVLNHRLDVIETLIRLGTKNINVRAGDYYELHTPLMVAAERKYTDVLELFVRLGVFDGPDRLEILDARNSYGQTPLHEAARQGNIPMIELLMKLGSQAINARNDYGNTPLHYAVESHNVKVLQTLLRFGSKYFGCRR